MENDIFDDGGQSWRQGTRLEETPDHVAAYALHYTAANIVLLAAALRNSEGRQAPSRFFALHTEATRVRPSVTLQVTGVADRK